MTNPLSVIQNAVSGSKPESSTASQSNSQTTTPRASLSNQHGGLFHKAKRLLMGQINKNDSVHKTVDAEFDIAHTNFVKLTDVNQQLRSHVMNYIQSIANCVSSSNSIVNDFSAILQDQNPFSSLLEQSKNCHSKFQIEKESQLISDLNTLVLKPLEIFIDQQRSLKLRCADRLNLVTDLDYYSSKVASLKEEKEKKIRDGKEIGMKENERYERNLQKLSTVKNNYTQFNCELVRDLNNIYRSRYSILGSCVNQFSRIEKEFAELYRSSLNEIKIIDENDETIKSQLNVLSEQIITPNPIIVNPTVLNAQMPNGISQSVNNSISEQQRRELERNIVVSPNPSQQQQSQYPQSSNPSQMYGVTASQLQDVHEQVQQPQPQIPATAVNKSVPPPPYPPQPQENPFMNTIQPVGMTQ